MVIAAFGGHVRQVSSHHQEERHSSSSSIIVVLYRQKQTHTWYCCTTHLLQIVQSLGDKLCLFHTHAAMGQPKLLAVSAVLQVLVSALSVKASDACSCLSGKNVCDKMQYASIVLRGTVVLNR